MSVDKLQERIRKIKNPSVIDFNLGPEYIPPHICERETYFVSAYEYFCTELLQGLKSIVPAVRFSLKTMALYGADGVIALENLLRMAKKLGYYVFLDCPDAFSAQEAQLYADRLFAENSSVYFDALVVSAYIGSDGLRGYADRLQQSGKDLFVLVRTANKSAQELQDLLTGSRHVYMAAADAINRYAENLLGRSGYSQVAMVSAANSADALRALRMKYKNLFMLVDGYDYPNANAKNCSHAFDQLGHGAIVCAGAGVAAAWQESPVDAQDFVRLAVASAERMCKNITRYTTVL